MHILFTMTALMGGLLSYEVDAQNTQKNDAGFGVSYTSPEGRIFSGRDRRMQAWADSSGKSAIVVYSGHFSPLQLALGDAQRILGVPSEEDTEIITPLSPAAFGGRNGLAGSVRLRSPNSVIAHVAAVQLNDSTAIGAVAVMESSADSVAVRVAAQSLVDILASAEVEDPPLDSILRSDLTGEWNLESEGSDSSGNYLNEENWTFSADGKFEYTKRFSVLVPGAEMVPENRVENGSWYAVGGSLILVSPEGRITVDVQIANEQMVLDGSLFRKKTN